eukprot:221152-Ditylum_brightwellii.AAC.1
MVDIRASAQRARIAVVTSLWMRFFLLVSNVSVFESGVINKDEAALAERKNSCKYFTLRVM